MQPNTRRHDTDDAETYQDKQMTVPEEGDLYHTKDRFEESVREGDVPARGYLTTPCWEWIERTRNGYGRFWAQGKNRTAHRVAYQLYIGEIPTIDPKRNTVIHHECGNKTCVNPEHLTAMTDQRNSQIAYANGDLELPTHEQAVKGGKNSPLDGPKISPETAVEIRDEYERTDKTYDDLADEHAVTSSTIGRIIRGERPDDPPLNNTTTPSTGDTVLGRYTYYEATHTVQFSTSDQDTNA